MDDTSHARKPDSIRALRAGPTQRAEWRAFRVARFVLLGVLVCAGLGAFGGGPLSTVRVSAGPVSVTCERVSRAGTAVLLVVRADPAPDGRLTLEIADYLDRAEVTAITPGPVSQRRADRRWFFEFETEPDSPAVVEFHLRFDRPGVRSGAVRVGEHRASFTALVLP